MQAPSRLRIEDTTICSRIVLGFGCGSISGFAAVVKQRPGLGFRARDAFLVLKRESPPPKSSVFSRALLRQLACQCGSARFRLTPIRNKGSRTQEARHGVGSRHYSPVSTRSAHSPELSRSERRSKGLRTHS